MSTILIVIAVVAVIALWVIGVQRKLVASDEICNNALRQINVQQVSRYDALLALVKLCREYATHEKDTLEEIVKLRKVTSNPNPTPSEISANEAALNELSAKIIAVAEQYPDLKANTTYLKTMDEVKNYEENVRLARMTFNDTVTKFNTQVRMFPTSIVAGMLGFPVKQYLEEDRKKAEYPSF